MFSSTAKLAPGLDPAPVPTVGSLGRNRLGLLFGTPLIPVGSALKYAPNPQAPSPSEEAPAPPCTGASFCRGFAPAMRLFSFPGPDDYGVGA